MSGRIAATVPAVRTAVGLPPPEARSTTGPILRLLRRLILLTTAVTLTTSLWAFTAVEHFAQVVHGQAAPAAVQLSTARAAMLKAEAIALDAGSLDTPEEARGRLLSQISIASQYLAQAAGSIAGGDDSRQRLQSVQGQILDYFTLVTRAWQEHSGNVPLSSAGLADAYSALHNGNGILPNLDTLVTDQQTAVDELGSSGWLDRWTVPLWLLPLAALGTLLVAAQLFLRRRLRRTFNPWLLLATAVLAGTAGFCGQRAGDDGIGRGTEGLIVTGSTADPGDQMRLLKEALQPVCVPDCDQALAPLFAADQDQDTPTLAGDLEALTAPPGSNVAVLIPLAALAVGGLAWVGFLGPVTEYRFPLR